MVATSTSRAENFQDAKRRLDAAVDALEGLLRHQLDEGGDSLIALGEQVRLLTAERDQLRAELDAALKRAERLESANDEVSGRLQVLMTSLKEQMPAAYR